MNAQDKALAQLNNRYRAVSFHPDDFMPGRIYHYTSAAGLCGIVSTGVLRASNFSYVNDSKEILYGRKLALESVWSRLVEHPPSGTRTMLDKVLAALQQVGQIQDFYIACFCEDSDLLSQWRGYGSARARFCIGFDTENLPSGLPYCLSKVMYDSTMQRQKVDNAIDQAVETLGTSSHIEFINGVAAALAEKLVREISFFKHPGFAEEHEWRAVHAAESEDRIDFDTSSGVLKPFVDLWVGWERLNGPIVEVVVGPQGSVAQSRSVEILLARYGYKDVEIKESAVPYREL